MASSLCYAQLPSAGLGNCLLIWARALIFARLNELPLGVSSWQHLHVGRILRREADQRRYKGFFLETSPLGAAQKWRALHTFAQVIEPPIQRLSTPSDGRATLYLFNQMPHWSDFFKDINDARELVKNELLAMLAPVYRDQLSQMNSPCIGIHVRMGDFRPLAENEDFAKVGSVRTPLEYFQNIIRGVREIHGSNLPVTLFSDGQDAELAPLLQMENVRRSGQNAAIVDLLLLARSQVVVTSPSSTFSLWSGFLADAPLILHPDHIHAPVRPASVNARFYEGGLRGPAADWNALFQRNIREIATAKVGAGS